MLMKNETADYLFDEKICLIQDRFGYRFSVDSVLLAHFARVKKHDLVADLGAGNGVISLLLSKLYSKSRFIAVEIQSRLADQALRNSIVNGVAPRLKVLHEDLQNLPRLLSAGSLEVVVSNPPYQTMNSGRLNPNIYRARARHEMVASVETFICVSSILLKNGGRAYFVFPSFRLAELIPVLKRYHLEPKTLQLLHPYLSSESRHFLIEACKNRHVGLRILQPLIFYRGKGIYSEALEKIYLDFKQKIAPA